MQRALPKLDDADRFTVLLFVQVLSDHSHTIIVLQRTFLMVLHFLDQTLVQHRRKIALQKELISFRPALFDISFELFLVVKQIPSGIVAHHRIIPAVSGFVGQKFCGVGRSDKDTLSGIFGNAAVKGFAVCIDLPGKIALCRFDFLCSFEGKQFADLTDPSALHRLDPALTVNLVDLPEEAVFHRKPSDKGGLSFSLLFADQHRHILKLAPGIEYPVDTTGKD